MSLPSPTSTKKRISTQPVTPKLGKVHFDFEYKYSYKNNHLYEGDSYSTDDNTLSADILSQDVRDVLKELYGEEPPPIILIAHSMGGAIAFHTAIRGLVPSRSGLVVIDVVEGTALEALSSMQSFVRGRKKVFKSIEHAVEWW